MSEQHTPGLWEKGNPLTIGSDTVKHYLITGPDGRTVADVGIWLDKVEEQEANADLITAAPELLESCQFFVTALETGLLVRDITKDGEPNWAFKMMDFVRELQKAQAAIAKAEG